MVRITGGPPTQVRRDAREVEFWTAPYSIPASAPGRELINLIRPIDCANGAAHGGSPDISSRGEAATKHIKAVLNANLR